jgi:hypothetical protein
MVNEQKTQHPRPYWHLDAKWIAGILLFFSLGACLLLYNLSALTERRQAVTLSAAVVANLFSPKGLDDTNGLNEFRQQVAKMPGTTVSPIPQFSSIKLSKHDALTLSPADLKIAIFSQITGPIYDIGLEAAAKQFTPNPAEQQQFVKQAAPLGILTTSTHTLIQSLFVASLCTSVILAAFLIFFSAKWGRLVSPGIVLLAISPIGTLASLLLLHPPAGAGLFGASVPTSVTQSVGGTLGHSYPYATALGVALLVAAFIGKIITSVTRQSHNALALARHSNE